MRKNYLVYMLFLLASLIGQVNQTILSVPDSTTAFGRTKPAGSLIFEEDCQRLFELDSSATSLTNAKRTLLNIKYRNAGVVRDPVIVETDTSVIVSDIKVRFYEGTGFSGDIKEFTVTGGEFLVDSGTDIITYIVADYNNKNPIIRKTNDLSEINGSTILPVATSMKIGSEISTLNWDSYGLGADEKQFKKDVELNRFRIKSGLAISETGTRNVRVTAGEVYYGTILTALDTVNTIADSIKFVYHTAGAWTFDNINQYNNTQYDNGTNLVSLSPNRYAVNWIFRNIDNHRNEIAILLGGGDYTLADAQASDIPTAPATISALYTPIGRIIVKLNDPTATVIEKIRTVNIATAGISNHNDLDGLQGGTAGQYYHMTQAQSDSNAYRNTANTFTQNNVFNKSVGIGIAPTNKLHLYDANSSIHLNEVNLGGTGVASWRLKHGLSYYGAYVGTTNNLIFYDYGNSREIMRFNSSGNVGIGVTPTYKLHSYVSTATTTPAFTIEQAGTGDASMQFLLTGEQAWSMGVDNNDANSFKIGTSGTDIGTNTKVTVTTTGTLIIGGSTPTTGAIVDIQSTTGAFIPPRMTTTQRNALTPANGMIIYNTTDNKFQGYENGAWVNLGL